MRRSHETLGVDSLLLKFGSTMSVGTWLMTVFVIGSLVYLVLAILAWPFPWAGTLQKLFGVVGLPIALCVTIYTGVLISATENGLWNNWFLPLVFVISAFATGIAAIVFMLSVFQLISPKSKIGVDIPKLEFANGRIIAFQFLMVIVFVIVGIRSANMRAMIGSAYGLLWWIGIVGFGLLLPFYAYFKQRPKPAYVSLVMSTFVLLGGFFLRYSILFAGQIRI